MTTSLSWQHLDDELSRWNDEGRQVVMWLRDDDAVTVTPAFDRLNALGRRYGIEVGIATIPAFTDAELTARFQAVGPAAAGLVAMCHGWRHDNHAKPRAPAEFGPDRADRDVEADLKQAKVAFETAVGMAQPFFVPPFGQIAPRFHTILQRVGFLGLSNQNGRQLARLARVAATTSWLPRCLAPRPLWPSTLDAHVDPIDWSRKTAKPDEHSATTLLGELRLRRLGYKPSNAPIGILGHHLVHDEAIWSSLERLLAHLRASKVVQFPPIATLMAAHRFTSSLQTPSPTPAIVAQ